MFSGVDNFLHLAQTHEDYKASLGDRRLDLASSSLRKATTFLFFCLKKKATICIGGR